MLNLIERSAVPPRKVRGYDWEEIARQCRLDRQILRDAKVAIEPGLDAIARNAKASAVRSPRATSHHTESRSKPRRGRPPKQVSPEMPHAPSRGGATSAPSKQPAEHQKPGTKARIIEEFPEPHFHKWIDPPSFPDALELHMRRHGDSYWHLHRAVVRDDENLDRSTIRHWLQGSKAPRSVASMEVLARIERRYRLPAGYFKAKLPHQTRSASGHVLDDIGAAERRRLAWHLPDDFNMRPRAEQEEILDWVRRVIISGSTDYRRFQAAAMKQRYAIRFPGVTYGQAASANDRHDHASDESEGGGASLADPDLTSGVINAPPLLAIEMAQLTLGRN